MWYLFYCESCEKRFELNCFLSEIDAGAMPVCPHCTGTQVSPRFSNPEFWTGSDDRLSSVRTHLVELTEGWTDSPPSDEPLPNKGEWLN